MSATAMSIPASALCELILAQSSACACLLRRDGIIHAIYGNASQVFGRPVSELENRSFTSLLPLPHRAGWNARLSRAFLGGTSGVAIQFAEDAPAVSVMLFPIWSAEGEIVFVAALAKPMPQTPAAVNSLDILETERGRFSHLLHDRIGQDLSSAGLQLDLLSMDLSQGAPAVLERIAAVQALLEVVMKTVRDFNRELYPEVTKRAGLRAALDQLAGSLRENFKGGVRVLLDATVQPAPEIAEGLYGIAQAASHLAIRRQNCSAVEILLKSLRPGPALEIRDNGATLDATPSAFGEGGLEMQWMHTIAIRAGIELEFESMPDGGTVVRASWPLVEKPGA